MVLRQDSNPRPINRKIKALPIAPPRHPLNAGGDEISELILPIQHSTKPGIYFGRGVSQRLCSLYYLMTLCLMISILELVSESEDLVFLQQKSTTAR